MRFLKINFESIKFRWFAEVFLIIAVAIIIAATFSCAFFSATYTDRVKFLGDDLAYEFSSLSSQNGDSFEDAAVSLAYDFENKNQIEVQVLNSKGMAFVSTTGFPPTGDFSSVYKSALKSKDGKNLFIGKSSAGERIMAVTTVIYNDKGEALGAYRWISSLNNMNKQVLLFNGIIIGISVFILIVCGFSGILFINSIVKPIKEIGNTARKIAHGNFDSEITVGRNDEIGELCDAVNNMAGELSRSEEIKNDFISSVSHELRTPLTAIRGWGETAKMSVGFDDELVGKGLDVVLSETERLSSLVEELLDFSRMQTGRLSVNMMPVDVSYLLTLASDMYTELARQQGIELVFTPPSVSPIVMGDADRLKQVFINIIDNAVKYTEKGGLVLVTEILEEGCVKIIVKDTGLGIPAGDIDRVKEKFFKSNKTVRGSGIGLAVADEIIKQHQGLLFIESTEGVGTSVTIVLPLTEETENKETNGEEITDAE